MRSLLVLSLLSLLVVSLVHATHAGIDANIEEEMLMEVDSSSMVEAELVDSLEAEAYKTDFISEDSKPAIWIINTNRFVAQSFMGIAIGNVPLGSRIVCESYRTGEYTTHMSARRNARERERSTRERRAGDER